MQFGDLKSVAGVKALNSYLAERSYIEGYCPSQADVSVFEAVDKAPASEYFHAVRWYNQIKSYNGSEISSWPGEKVAVSGGAAADDDDDDDDDIDLFGSDDEDADEAAKIREQRLADYAARKAKKPGPIAKSSIVLDVKPWDDETDMAELEKCVRAVQCDGLLWGASKLVPVGYGIRKLVISCVVEDDKVGTDYLEEEITKNEDFIQSMDIAAFNKI